MLEQIIEHPARAPPDTFVLMLKAALKFFPQFRRINLTGQPAITAKFTPVFPLNGGDDDPPQALRPPGLHLLGIDESDEIGLDVS